MKIGIDIRSLLDRQYSGVSEHTYNLLKSVLSLDQDNNYKLFCNAFKKDADFLKEFEFENLEIVKTRIPNKIFNNILQGVIGVPKIDRLLGVDVFFMPNIGFASLSSNCKKIITIHDLSYIRYPEFFNLKRRMWHQIINVKKLLAKFDMIIAVSNNTKNDIVELLGIDASKITVIYNGIDQAFKIIKDSCLLENVKRKYKLPDKFILSLATIEPRKNISGMISAFGECVMRKKIDEKYSLIIAGGAGWKNKSIYRSWQKSPCKERIKFIGYVDKTDKPALYNLADLFLYPSFYEGFGFPPLEALASGTPIVASNQSSLPEILGGNTCWVNPYDINEIAGAIEISLRKKQPNADREKISELIAGKFSWQKSAQNFLDILLDI